MMLNFSNFLIEMAAASSSESSDDKGKLHELLLAKHLNPTGSLPSHHRAEADIYGDKSEGGTPEQVHDKLKTRISKAAYDEIDSHAKQTAASLLSHLEKKGYNNKHINTVHWTSNRDTAKKPGDHEKTTGIRDPNANADLILSYKHPETGDVKHVGISAKYGTNEQPNYRNDGLASLEQKAGLAPGSLTSIQKAHDQDMADRLGYTGTKEERHKQYKVGRALKGKEREDWKKSGGDNKSFQPVSDEAKRAREAEDASVVARKKMARTLDSGFGQMNDEQLRSFIRGQVSPPTKIYHAVAHSHVQDDGTAVSKVGDMDKIADDHLNQFKNIRVKKGNGIVVQFVGDYNGKERPVAQQVLKTGSGPVKGSAGAFNLVSIPKKLSNSPAAKTKTVAPAKTATPVAAPVATEPKHPIVAASTHGGKQFYSPSEQEHILGLA